MDRIKPTSETEAAEAVRGAAERGSAFEILAGGTKREFGRPVAADAFLDVSALSGILKYEPEELVLTARAATPIADIQAALAEKRQMLAFEPADWGPLFGNEAGRATLGGIVATNACGSRRVKGGAVRDSVIGCRFVNGRGEIVKAGGPVIKNVTGFDVPKLMCGAFGTLGVLTEISLKVGPAPQRAATIAIGNCGAELGLRLLRDAFSFPVDPTGLAYFPKVFAARANFGEGAALMRIEGTLAAVAEKLELMKTRFAGHDLVTLDDDMTRAVFREIDTGAVFANRDSDLWRICVPASHASEAVTSSGASEWYADWGGGLLWLGLPASEQTAARLRALTARFAGHATLMRASEEARKRLAVFEPEPPARAELTRSVKAAFDPKRVLNPGRMFENV